MKYLTYIISLLFVLAFVGCNQAKADDEKEIATMKALKTCEAALKEAVEETHEARIDAMVGNIKEMVVMKAADNLLTSGMWDYPSVSYVTIANMNEKVSSDWSDNGAGIWTYAPTGGTIVYIENTYDYTITVSH